MTDKCDKKCQGPEAIKRETVEYYDKRFGDLSPEKVLGRCKNLRKVMDPLIDFATIKKGDVILDLGCGPGTLAITLAQNFKEAEIYGVDLSEKTLNLARKVIFSLGLNDAIKLERGDIEDLPFPDDFFDVVLSQAVINLVPRKKLAFEEISRVTKPDGHIVISDCIKKAEVEKGSELWSKCITGAPTIDEFEAYVSEAGLKIEERLDITEDTKGLVKDKLWNWPEFLDYDLEYYVFKICRNG
ncbi:MAG: methyltransferase domain-containing protein [Halobacteriota archaeon]|nr:methyltransferase domain-containing protein [Halobacteriota archaeon]